VSVTLVLAVTAAVAASMGYMAARKHGDDEAEGHRDRDQDGDRTDEKKPDAKKADERRDEDERRGEDNATQRNKPRPAKKKGAGPSPFVGLPLALGDVVSSGSEERWLAGALVAREGDRVVGCVFLAPEGTVNKAVAVFAAPRKEIWWMSPVEIASPDEPPATIEVAGTAMQRKGRLPVALERLGQGVPPVGEEGIWAAYDRGRDVAIVVSSQGKAHAWSGVRVEEHEYDRLGGGGD
jgi:hypothetical protein